MLSASVLPTILWWLKRFFFTLSCLIILKDAMCTYGILIRVYSLPLHPLCLDINVNND